MVSYLPTLSKMPNVIRKGRNAHEGYQRAWGIEFGGLVQNVLEDPLYKDAASQIEGYSIVAPVRRINIFLIMKFFMGKIPFGHIVEFGSYRGGNALFMAYVAKQLYPGMKVYALDTFEGMPETDFSIDVHKEGDFSDALLENFQHKIQEMKLDNLIPVKGLFEDTAEGVLKEAQNVSLAHIDCDIYSAVKYSYDVVKPFMVDGGYVVFDDATVSSCLGATEAVEELLYHRDGLFAEQIFPHFVFRAFK